MLTMRLWMMVFVVAFALAWFGCHRRPSLLDQPPPIGNDGPVPRRPDNWPPAGMSCMGRNDCPTDQVCVERVCRYRETSVAGEILATAAAAQVEAGDWDGAIRTYEEALERFEAANAPVPPEVLCASAALILRTATDSESRERGAQRADACFRSSLPGSPQREEARRAVARLRFEGLDVALFDRVDPAERFFTREPSRPTLDALAIEVHVPDDDQPGLAPLREQLAGEAAHRAIAECFLQDWELRHDHSARAQLLLRYATRLRDMGTYDVYDPEVQIETTTASQDGFEPCIARSLSSVITPPRLSRMVAWQTNLEIIARAP